MEYLEMKNLRWKNKLTGNVIRVMTIAEGWVMARHKGAMPFVLTLKEFQFRYERVADEPE